MIEEKEKTNLELQIEDLKKRGYFDIHEVLPKIFWEVAHHYLFRDTKFVSKEERFKFAKDYLVNSELFKEIDIYGAWDYTPDGSEETEHFPDWQASFSCSINPEWQYGIWVNYEAKERPDYLYTIFAQHKWCINKFKPSYSEFSYTITLGDVIDNCVLEENGSLSYNLYDLVKFIIGTSHRAISYCFYSGAYSIGHNYYKKYWSDRFYYTVKKPLYNWFKDKACRTLCKVLVWYGNRSPYVEKVEFSALPENWYPRFDINYILKDGLSDDDYAYHYHKYYIKGLMKKELFDEIRQNFRKREPDGSLSRPYYYVPIAE